MQKPDNTPHKHAPLPQAFRAALQGIETASKERNFRIELCFAAAAVILGLWLEIDGASWMAVLICCGTVLALECVNTAIEAMIDLCHPEIHPLAKIAKDCAAGAVLIASIMALICAFMIYLIPFLTKIGVYPWI